MMRQLARLGFILFSFETFGYESVTFITAQDQFTVKKSAQHYTVEGQQVPKDLLTLLQPLLAGTATDDCPKKLGKPNLSARINTGGKAEIRDFFVSRGLVRVGNQCFFATGDGLLYLPQHRSWLIGPFKQSVLFRSPLKITNNGQVMADLVQKNGEWFDNKPKTELDWDFFDKFEQSMKDYKVQYRVSRDAGKGKVWATLESGKERYVLFKIAPKIWAIQRPGNGWLDVSGDWAFWFDFDNGVWQDRRLPIMQRVEAPGAKPEDKLAAMTELDSGWSRALEDFYHRRLLDKEEDTKIREHALDRMKSKPGWRNIAAEIEFLQTNPNDEMLRDATQALRARNPKGTVFTLGSDRAKVIQEWTEWWQKNSNRKKD